MNKTLTAIAATALTITAIATATPAAADDNAVRKATTMAKMAWTELDYSDQQNICNGWYVMPSYTKSELAKIIRDSAYFYISTYDSKRAAYRLLNWGC